MDTSNKKLLSIKEAAQLLGVSPLTLRNWDKAGKLSASRHPLNNYRVYRREDIEKLLTEIETNKEPRPISRQSRPTRSTEQSVGPKKLTVKHEED